MLARFFIERPVFASVASIVIVLCGLASAFFLPIEQSPEITPPTVVVSARYPGADADTVSQSIAIPIEQELSGIEHLIYYQSASSNDGSLSITCTFEIGSDLDIAAVEVQNRLKRAETRLPAEVTRQGITVAKRQTNILSVITLESSKAEFDEVYLTNYANINLLDALKRVSGVGDVLIFGSKDYSMRIWLNPDRLAAQDLTVTDVTAAIREQNALFAAGRIGAEPDDGTVVFTIPVTTKGRLENPEEYEDIILRARPDGSMLRLRDVARVELSALSYDASGRHNGKPAVPILVFQQPGANALSTMRGVMDRMEELKLQFPEGVSYSSPFDTTRFIDESISEVTKTLLEAVLLVVLVVYIFLGNWHPALIPLLAIPVSIIGTFIGMLALGFSINTLTLFGLVLAIGIVVDDAILVVENVERVLHEEDLTPREATIKAMGQVFGPVISSVLVLVAVYLPVSFLTGLTGAMYRQFAITIAVSVTISGFVALSLSPALCAILLSRSEKKLLPFRIFDWCLAKVTRVYTGTVRLSIRLGVVMVLLFAGLIWGTYQLFARVPGGLVPQEDQGYFIVAVQLPQGASLNRTMAVMEEVEQFILQQPEVEHVVALAGQDFLSGFVPSTSAGVMFVNLQNWKYRTDPQKHVDAVVGRVFGRFIGMKEALVLAFNPPPIRGLGFRAGFEFQLEGRGRSDIRELAQVTQQFMGVLSQNPKLTSLSSVLNMGLPQIYVEVDRTHAMAMGLPLREIFDSLQAYLGALYVNDFNKYGRVYRVQVQAGSEFRDDPEDIRRIYVRNNAGQMVELSSVVDVSMRSGPNLVNRFNSYPSVQISGAPAPGSSTGESIALIQAAAAESLPEGYAIEWSGGSYQEVQAGNQAPFIFLFGMVMVFLVLAAQYEKWFMPFAVILAVPIALLGAIGAIFLLGMNKDLYFQVGLLTLIGLAAKNAILIVEFASVARESGKGLVDAAAEAARLRLRPILMTSLSFILGVLPLALSEGAGAAGRRSIGTGVIGGMLTATFLAIFFVPLFFVIIQWMSEIRFRRKKPALATESNQENAQ